MDEERSAIVRARLTKAAGRLATADADLAAARYDDAASRAYYAMFRAARARLAARLLTLVLPEAPAQPPGVQTGMSNGPVGTHRPTT